MSVWNYTISRENPKDVPYQNMNFGTTKIRHTALISRVSMDLLRIENSPLALNSHGPRSSTVHPVHFH